MTGDEPKPADAARDLLWAFAVANEKPISMTATDLENLLNILFLNETAIFKISEAVSKMHVGDVAGSKAANSAAVDTAIKALESSKLLRSQMLTKIIGDMSGEVLSHEP